MHTLSAFSASIATASTNTVITAAADQVVTTQNSRIVPETDRQLLAGYCAGVGMTQIFLDSPTLLQNGRPSIYPVDKGAIGGNLSCVNYFGERGMTLPGREQVGLLTTTDDAGTQTHFGLLWHTRRFVQAPAGQIKTIQMTATGAGGNLVWSSPLTPQLTAGLKRGRYRCVGLAAQGTNLIAARLIFPQQVDRPGCLCTPDASTFEFDYFRNGNAGLFGEFDNDNLPQLECFGTGALSGSIVAYMDIINVPNTPMN